MLTDDFINKLKEKSGKSRIKEKFQQIGIEISEILSDPKHKALYIKLAKEHNPEFLIATAKDVATRKNIENKGGYFMRILQTKSFFKTELKVKNFKPAVKKPASKK